MPSAHIVKELDVKRSFRVAQVAGMFDVPLETRTRQEWDVNLPLEERSWQIGLIFGPSGCGKTTIARELWPDNYIRGYTWSNDAVLDNFPKHLSSKEIVAALTSVGFSSPPQWIKPYNVLSTGQQMRCDLARALCSDDDLIVFDEFTSVVDRQVAQIGSAALAKTIRRKPGKQFIAVTCHADVLEWLTPDWTYEPATNTFSWRCLRRPEITLQIYRTSTQAWRLFRDYHYLNKNLHRSAACHLAEWNGQPVAFVAVLPLIGFKGCYRASRTVVLPDFQGIGIGGAMSDYIADYYLSQGKRYRSSSSHPAFIAHRNTSPKWKLVEVFKSGTTSHAGTRAGANHSNGRALVTFEYVGESKDK